MENIKGKEKNNYNLITNKKMIDIKVIWHKIPDTDSVLSAILLADYLNKKWIYNAIPYIQGKLNNETKYLLNSLDIETPEIATHFEKWTTIALVDHNEKFQSLDNLEELNVEYLVDHHSVDFKTPAPVNIRMEKLCSTCSVLYKMYIESWFEIDKKTAKIMLAWVLSDSLLFKSATTTKEDVDIAEKLKDISGVPSCDDFAMPMFNAKSDLWDISIEELIKSDYKEFDFNWTKAWIWTLETTNPDYALNKKEEIVKWLQKIKEKDWLDFIMLSVVDIIWENNTSIVLEWKDSEIIEKVFGWIVENNLIDLWNKLSRKKQIVPDLISYYK